jgi:mRNA-degrading endonuclease RelE of RelBE toxin-antitoxin system
MFDVIPTPRFLRQVKKLKKKYKSLVSELIQFEESLSENPTQGTDLGNNTIAVVCVSTDDPSIFLATKLE